MRIFLRLQQYRAGQNLLTVGWVYKEIYLLIELLWSTPERPQASKGAQTVLKMTKMTLQRKKMLKGILSGEVWIEWMRRMGSDLVNRHMSLY